MVRLCSSKIARVMARSMKKNLTNLFLQILVFWQIYFFMLLAISLAIFELQRRTIPHFNPLNNSFWPYEGPFCCRANSFWAIWPNVRPIFFWIILWSEESRKKYQIWTWNLLSRCLKIWRKKFAKQMNLDWEASINSKICNLYYFEMYSSQKIEI